MMDWAAMATGAGVLLVGLAQVRTWRKNGSDQKRRDEAEFVKRAIRESETEMAYQSIRSELHHPDHGLGAIEKKVTAVCETVARHDERITNLEEG